MSSVIETRRRVTLFRGVHPVKFKGARNPEKALQMAEDELLTRGVVQHGDLIVFTIGEPFGRADEIFAAVSHLPHLLSFALVEDIAFRANAKELFSYAAGGFRDFTRIAGSHPEMWRDICLANRDVLIREVDTYQSQLDRLRSMLEQNDGKALEEVFGHARTARAEWLAGKQDS